MANNFRADRVGMEIKHEVNEILQKKVRDPRVQGVIPYLNHFACLTSKQPIRMDGLQHLYTFWSIGK